MGYVPDKEIGLGSTNLKEIFILFITMILVAIGTTWSLKSCMGHDADSYLLAIMSIQDVTPYYWGQNRFGNLLPFLASWVNDIYLNFKFQVFLRAFMASSIPVVVFVLMDVKKHLLLKYIFAISLFFFIFKTHLIMTLWTYGQPYGTSVFLLLIFLFINKLNKFNLDYKSVILLLLALSIAFLIFFVNLGLIILILPIFVGFLIISFEKEKFYQLITLLLGWILAKFHSSLYGLKYGLKDYSTLDLQHFFDNIYQVFFTKNIFRLYPNTSYTFLVILMICYFLSLYYLQKRLVYKNVNQFLLKNIIILMSVAIYFIVVSNLHWIQINFFLAKYFIISFAFLIPLMSITFIDAGIKLINKNIMYVFILAFFIYALYRTLFPIVFSCTFSGIKSHPQRIEHIAKIANDYNVSIIVGDYWTGWPALYETIHKRQIEGKKKPKQVYGFIYRGLEMKHQIQKYINNSETIQLLCIDLDSKQCFKKSTHYYDGIWPQHTYLLSSNILSDGTKVIILSMNKNKSTYTSAEDPVSRLVMKSNYIRTHNELINEPLHSPLIKLGIKNFPIINKVNTNYHIDISITNLSDEIIYSRGKYPISISYNIYNSNNIQLYLKGTGSDGEALRTPLNIGLLPRETDNIKMRLKTPNKSGNYTVEIDMVQDGAFWFKDKGNKTIRKVITIK